MWNNKNNKVKIYPTKRWNSI